MLYTLNLHSDVCQLFLNKIGKKIIGKKKKQYPLLSGLSIRNIPWVNLIPSHPGGCSVDNIQNNTQQKRYYEWDPQHELLTTADFSSTTVEYAACQKQRSIPVPPQNNIIS